jgi:hypothetical protein
VIKSRRIRGAEHAARMGDVRDARTVLVGNPNRKNTYKTGVDGRIILKLIFNKWDWGA